MDVVSAERAAAFEFARHLSDENFRKTLREIGCGDAQDVVVTVDSATMAHVMERVFKRTRSPALVAFRPADRPNDFALIVVRAVTAGDGGKVGDGLAVSPQWTIGMLFASAMASADQTYDLNDQFGYQLHPVPRLVAA